MSKNYVCICGKEFNNSQAFNGHKSRSKIHQLNKYGDLNLFNEATSERIKTYKLTVAIKNKENKAHNQEVMLNQLEIWISEQHRCEKCGKIMTEYYGSGRFCSRSCANRRTHSKETRVKISKSLSTNKIKKYCTICGKVISSRSKTGYCLNCIRTAPELSERRKLQSKHASSCVKPENRKYWQPRNQISYPERFFMRVLKNNNIDYIHDYKVNVDNKHWYFLDFYIIKNDVKLDLEIDGKQHEYEDRKQSDLKRNKDLNKLGYVVYRIKWNEINSSDGKLLMKSKIDSFISYYNSL